MSLLFSRYPRLGAIVIDWRCGTSPDPLYPSLFLSPSLSSFASTSLSFSFFLSLFNPCLLYRLVIHCLATPMRRVWRHVHRHTITCRRHEQHMHTYGTHTHKLDRYGVLRAEYSSVWDAHCGVRSEHLVFMTFLCMILSAHYEVSCPARYPCPHSVNVILQLRSIYICVDATNVVVTNATVLRRSLHECGSVIIICSFNNHDWLLKMKTFILSGCFRLIELCILCNLERFSLSNQSIKIVTDVSPNF